MTKTFIDIGAHFGQSLEVAIDPRYAFEKILCFEPSTLAFSQLRRIHDKRVSLFQFGLGDSEGVVKLFGSGELGGSIFNEKVQKPSHLQTKTETILIKSAAIELRTFIEEATEVFIKLNCEGSEIAILESLLQHNLLSEKTFVYVDFDIRKVSGFEHLATEMQENLAQKRVAFSMPEDFGSGGAEGVRSWLDTFCGVSRVPITRRITYLFRFHQDPFLWIYRSISKFLPQKKRTAWFRLASRFGVISWIRR